MAIGPIIKFFLGVGDYISPDPDAMERAGDSASTHSMYHRRIVTIAAVAGVLGTVAALTGAIYAPEAPPGVEKPVFALVLVAFGCIAGIILGTSGACLFAPREFLTGPVGLKWMRLIGTESVFVSRLVCFIISVLLPVTIACLIALFPARK